MASCWPDQKRGGVGKPEKSSSQIDDLDNLNVECRNCLYYVKLECHRYPTLVFKSPDSFCGEFKLKLVPREPEVE